MDSTRFSILCILATGLLLQACQQPQPNPPQPATSTSGFRVKALTEELPANAAKVTLFSYDTQGRLSGLIAYQTPDSSQANVERSTYQYDGQNRLIRQQRQLIVRPTTIFFTAPLAEAHQFTYDASGQLVQIRFLARYSASSTPVQYSVDPSVLDSPSTPYQLATLQYDQSGRLVSLNKVNYAQGNQGAVAITNTYDYTNADLTSAHTITLQSGTQISNTTSTISYDTQTNPFYGRYVIGRYFGGIADFFQNLSTLSPHNITRLDGVSYNYEYSAAGLPTVRYTYTDKLVQTLRFTYESY